MISIRDSIEMDVTPGQIFSWFARMPEQYASWHPDHVGCRVIHGSMLEPGSEVECREYLHGKLHTLHFKVDKVVKDKRLEFAIKGMGKGAFEAELRGDKIRFNAELDIGSDIPVLGRLADIIFRLFFKRRIALMSQHMAEEGQNLKAILESNNRGQTTFRHNQLH